MCCLFGLMDYRAVFTKRQREKIIKCLGVESMERGRDATGISYVHEDKINVFKKPLPANKVYFHLPTDANTIIGHTRFTTQGSEKKNFNNHPFAGKCGDTDFALAHNGVLYNDKTLRKSLKLPRTNIETDSYIAVQLLEQYKALDFHAIRQMAETVEGSFCFSIMDDNGKVYLVKGDNPLAFYHFDAGFYVYVSTEEILKKALNRLGLMQLPHERVKLNAGNILCIEPNGEMQIESFENYYWSYHHFSRPYACSAFDDYFGEYSFEDEYITQLKDIASCFGYTAEDIDRLLDEGFSPEEIEEFFYCECCLNERF